MSEVIKGIQAVDINREMREAYLQYSMSVIVGRALPDVRDGLKPVHRRILFAQNEMSNTHDKPYKKSARVVGDVIGKYHPHGDTAVYDTMVRMAQDFSLRYILEDGQGNFGSIDGDSPAAMRYTEIRMTKLAEELLADIEKETVPFGPNYDGSLEIPHVLPAKFPNLLINGSTGIAVGMATNIPPHNLTEIINGCLHLIHNPDCTVDDLMEIIPGPDFPSSGVIVNRSGIVSAYKKGRGSIVIKAVAEIVKNKERDEIIVTELPYQVNKARMIESIADLVRDKHIEGISDIRDESSREGMRIVVLVKRGEDPNIILNRLYKFTQMQISYAIQLLALDSKNQPVTFDLKGVLSAFLDHRREVITKRCLFDLRKAQEKAHILEGLKRALDLIDQVIALIRGSDQASLAKERLVADLSFSEKQAQAILEMRLQRLTGLEREKLQAELEELVKQIAWLKMVLGDAKEIDKIIFNELTEIRDKFGDKRKTIIEGELTEFEDEDLIKDETVVVTFTNTGYIKRIPLDQYRLQKRGGKGMKGMETREEDAVKDIFVVSTKTNLLVFTNKGRLYAVKVYRLPVGSRTAQGKSINNVVNLAAGEKVMAILPTEKFTEDKFVVMITKNGIIKKTSLDAFANLRVSGMIALTTDLDDNVIDVKISDGSSQLIITTKEGMGIRFDENDVRAMGRSARGVKGITLGRGDEVVAMEVFENESKDVLLVVTENGYGKRCEREDFRLQTRGGVGVISSKGTDKLGNVVGSRKVKEQFNVILTTNKGQLIRTRVSEIRLVDRKSQGVKLINLHEGEIVTGFAAFLDDQDEVEIPTVLN